MPSLETFLRTAVDAARAAGDLALSLQNALGPAQPKGEKDLVTRADLECDALIRARLASAFPEHGLVTEEAEALRPGGEYCWYADPIDGTINYARGLPLWGVSVALARQGSVLCGAIYLPVLHEIYTAVAGGGAFLNGKPMRVSPVSALHLAVVSHGDFNVGTDRPARDRLNRETLESAAAAMGATQRLKCLGSAVAEGAFVAAGRLDAYWMNNYYPWDVAATSLLVAEAGGRVTDLRGGAFGLEKRTALFSNGALHEDLLALLASKREQTLK